MSLHIKTPTVPLVCFTVWGTHLPSSYVFVWYVVRICTCAPHCVWCVSMQFPRAHSSAPASLLDPVSLEEEVELAGMWMAVSHCVKSSVLQSTRYIHYELTNTWSMATPSPSLLSSSSSLSSSQSWCSIHS